MKSNFTSIILSGAAVAAMLLLAGCAKEDGFNPVDKSCAELELTDVNSGEMLSKAAIDGTGFPRDGRIGLFFFKDEAGAELYGDGACSNVEYSFNQDKSKWTANPAIRVGSTPGYLYGYYPYNGADKDVKAIAVESSFDGDDVMYVAKQDPVTDQTAGNVAITMRHALARVSITVKNKGYSGAAKLSRIEFVGAKTAQSGTLNALDGSITATKSDVTLEVPEANQDITAAGTRYECLLVPSEVDASAQNVTLRLTIDGQQKTVSLTGKNALKIVSGVKARLEIDLSDTGLSVVGGIQVDDWQTVTVGGYTVTVKIGDEVTSHDILTDIYAEGKNVRIKASSESDNFLECTLTGTAEVSKNISGNVYTFTISNITSDAIATIGYEKLVDIKVTTLSNNPEMGSIIAEGKFYKGKTIILKAVANYGYQFIEWQDTAGKTLSTENPYSVNLTSDLAVIAVFDSYGALPGIFTVNDSGKKVRFSRGNLWYGIADVPLEPTFNFETNQYDFASIWDENHVSHFWWGETEAIRDKYEPEAAPNSVFFTNKDEFHVNGALYGAYKSLSIDEWLYLIKDRPASTIGGTENARFAKATINVNNSAYVNGLILFPDEFSAPVDVKIPQGINSNNAAFDTNIYSVEDWSELESEGAVFLSAAGRRVRSDTYDVGSDGFYWSTSTITEIIEDGFDYMVYSKYMHFNSDIVTNSKEIWEAYSIRLVTEVK